MRAGAQVGRHADQLGRAVPRARATAPVPVRPRCRGQRTHAAGRQARHSRHAAHQAQGARRQGLDQVHEPRPGAGAHALRGAARRRDLRRGPHRRSGLSHLALADARQHQGRPRCRAHGRPLAGPRPQQDHSVVVCFIRHRLLASTRDLLDALHSLGAFDHRRHRTATEPRIAATRPT